MLRQASRASTTTTSSNRASRWISSTAIVKAASARSAVDQPRRAKQNATIGSRAGSSSSRALGRALAIERFDPALQGDQQRIAPAIQRLAPQAP